ncbi:hypothetical protein BD777DRAFT_136436 [Yarrowia lipolytica]|nr:hypothetical protein BD777DRAFT_136436 [Yarrowia lipolytica]
MNVTELVVLFSHIHLSSLLLEGNQQLPRNLPSATTTDPRYFCDSLESKVVVVTTRWKFGLKKSPVPRYAIQPCGILTCMKVLWTQVADSSPDGARYLTWSKVLSVDLHQLGSVEFQLYWISARSTATIGSTRSTVAIGSTRSTATIGSVRSTATTGSISCDDTITCTSTLMKHVELISNQSEAQSV